MKAVLFDSLARELHGPGTRRGLMRLLVILAGSILAAVLRYVPATLAWDDDQGSSHRRHRRSARHSHRHNTGRHKKHRPRKRKPRPRHHDQGDTGGTSPCQKRVCTPGVCVDEPDGCGGTLECRCGSTHDCVEGTCQPCDVCQPAGACAYDSLAEAVDDPAGPSTIRMCPGTYHGNAFIARNVDVIGAGDGPDETTNTILTSSATHIGIVAVGGPIIVALRRLRVTGARIKDDVGAGVRVNDAEVTLEDCTIIDNHTVFNGGGLSNSAGNVSLINTNITDNRAEPATLPSPFGRGGGIYTYNPDSKLTLDATSRVTGNVASTDGGGLYNDFDASEVTLTSADTVTGNTPNNCFGARSGPTDACAPPSTP